MSEDSEAGYHSDLPPEDLPERDLYEAIDKWLKGVKEGDPKSLAISHLADLLIADGDLFFAKDEPEKEEVTNRRKSIKIAMDQEVPTPGYNEAKDNLETILIDGKFLEHESATVVLSDEVPEGQGQGMFINSKARQNLGRELNKHKQDAITPPNDSKT